MPAIDMRERREALGMTQKEVADALGISQGAYSMIESGDSIPNAERATEVARVLQSTVEDLWGATPRGQEA